MCVAHEMKLGEQMERCGATTSSLCSRMPSGHIPTQDNLRLIKMLEVISTQANSNLA